MRNKEIKLTRDAEWLRGFAIKKGGVIEMKFVREVEISFDVDKFIDTYCLDEKSSDEMIMDALSNWRDGLDDCYYYAVSTEDLYNAFIKDIKEKLKIPRKLNLLEVFDACCSNIVVPYKYARKWAKALPLIREKLKDE